MNVLLIAQCSKQALQHSRRVLDQFAERKGERTWQTLITQEGLLMLRKLLRKSARRNTAVACWWLKAGAHAELLWVVGRRAAFNQDGAVPTHQTRRDILRRADENQWHRQETIACLAALGGLFHDFGKANRLFQDKLRAAARRAEPVRHEWISLQLFAAFVNGRADHEWLAALAQVSAEAEAQVMTWLAAQARMAAAPSAPALMHDHRLLDNPFATHLNSPLARVVGWLIVSHHRLPHADHSDNPAVNPRPPMPLARQADTWLQRKYVNVLWNSPQCAGSSVADCAGLWQFPHGTPLLSHTWRNKARLIAARALQHLPLLQQDWLHDCFTAHLARLCLMLADHGYSRQGALPARQDSAYGAYANTDSGSGALKQKLDEHNLSVGWLGLQIAAQLPQLRHSLPQLGHHSGLRKPTPDARFQWQNKAFALAQAVAEDSASGGFFGINMASTGCGKTFANARIMYGLCREQDGCRFSIALGLRTLTLQTGTALRKRLRLAEDELAVLVGSTAVRQLHALAQQQDAANTADAAGVAGAANAVGTTATGGSESAADLLDQDSYLHYEGELDQGRLGRMLAHDPHLRRLLSAPILVSTVDYLIPATECERGGHQIGPMLRLLSGDLVLDEPDDFDLNDLPALSRLVHWAGMLGSRVLLSSATLPPALVEALFAAYQAGRRLYHAACGAPGPQPPVICAWFDEFGTQHARCAEQATLAGQHQHFVQRRVTHLAQHGSALQRGDWLRVQKPSDVSDTTQRKACAVANMASSMRKGALRVHQAHASLTPQGQHMVSFGLLRFANIRQLVAVAQAMLGQPWPEDYAVFYCIYHSQHPLALRSAMENMLDQALTRHDPAQVWQTPAVQSALTRSNARNVLFLVFATAVAEVGRDHDYDWCVLEPSSLRSLIQVAGRVQRHRRQPPASPNVLLLNRNFRALCGERPAYAKPGFENDKMALNSKDLRKAIPQEALEIITARLRIMQADTLQPDCNLADLEHAQLRARLLGQDGLYPWHAALWWQQPVQWCHEVQHVTRFRAGSPKQTYLFYLEDAQEVAELHAVTADRQLNQQDHQMLQRPQFTPATGVQPWLPLDVGSQLIALAETLDMSVAQASWRFGVIELDPKVNDYCYVPEFGVYRPLG